MMEHARTHHSSTTATDDQARRTRFARIVYLVAAIYGLLVLIPGFFLEARVGADTPPAVTHPEYYYGFYGVTLVWQIAFLLIARDPLRYRALMPITVLEKLSFAISAFWLVGIGRTSPRLLLFPSIDLVLGALFVVAFLRLRGARS